jgi:hypothetical protein
MRGVRQKNSNTFFDGLSGLVGLGGLEDSVHEPNRGRGSRCFGREGGGMGIDHARMAGG